MFGGFYAPGFGRTKIVLMLVRVVLAMLSVGIGLMLLLGLLAPWHPLADSMAQFRYHLVVAAGVVLALLSLIRAWRWAGCLLVSLLAGFAGLVATVTPDTVAKAAVTPAPPLTLMQFNLLYDNKSLESVIGLVRERRPDFVTLQEITPANHYVLAALSKEYPYQVRCHYSRSGDVAVLSRHPQVAGSADGCVPDDGLSWMQVEIDGWRMSVAALHLRWPYPFGQNRNIDRLEAYLKNIPKPVLMGGDFNSAPWSHSVRRIERAVDAKAVRGLRLTLKVRPYSWAPAVRLPVDHILVPKGMVADSVETGPNIGSDHLPVIARARWDWGADPN